MTRIGVDVPQFQVRFEGEDTVESTLAFVLLDLESLKPLVGRFSLSQEDQLYAIEKAAKSLRADGRFTIEQEDQLYAIEQAAKQLRSAT